MLKILALLALLHIIYVDSLFFPTVTPSNSCGCGCGGRRKRDIGHVRGFAVHQEGVELEHNQCNSQEFSEVIQKHLNKPTLKKSQLAIYKELDDAYPDSMLTVICVKDASASYQADARRYCMEGNEGKHCYVFEY